jgi:hypothetical protein
MLLMSFTIYRVTRKTVYTLQRTKYCLKLFVAISTVQLSKCPLVTYIKVRYKSYLRTSSKFNRKYTINHLNRYCVFWIVYAILEGALIFNVFLGAWCWVQFLKVFWILVDNRLHCLPDSLLDYDHCFEKIKVRSCDHQAVCVCICPLINICRVEKSFKILVCISRHLSQSQRSISQIPPFSLRFHLGMCQIRLSEGIYKYQQLKKKFSATALKTVLASAHTQMT